MQIKLRVSKITLLALHLLNLYGWGELVGSCSLWPLPALPIEHMFQLTSHGKCHLCSPSKIWRLRMSDLLRMTYMNTTVIHGDIADSGQMFKYWSWALTLHMFSEVQNAAVSLVLIFHLLQVEVDLTIPDIIEVCTAQSLLSLYVLYLHTGGGKDSGTMLLRCIKAREFWQRSYKC